MKKKNASPAPRLIWRLSFGPCARVKVADTLVMRLHGRLSFLDVTVVSGDVETEGRDVISADVGTSVRSVDHLSVSDVDTNVDDMATGRAGEEDEITRGGVGSGGTLLGLHSSSAGAKLVRAEAKAVHPTRESRAVNTNGLVSRARVDGAGVSGASSEGRSSLDR